MKEKYLFFVLLTASLVILAAAGLGKDKLQLEKMPIEKKIEQAMQNLPALPEEIEINKIQGLIAFSHYEGLLGKDIFAQAQPEPGQEPVVKKTVSPLEEQTPLFVYKGQIGLGARLMVIIEQTRSGETFMVARGESVDGYKVLEITANEVVLSKEGKERLILNRQEEP